MLGAAASGSAFTGSGRNSASMAMAALAAVGLLCYGTSLFLLPRAAAAGYDGWMQRERVNAAHGQAENEQ